MRLQPAVFSVGLLSSLCEAARAPVYTSGSSAQADNAAALDYEDSRLYLAHRLGLSQNYRLDETSDAAISLINQASANQASLFGAQPGKDGRRRTLVVVEGVEAAENLFDSRTPDFHIDSAFDIDSNYNLVSTLLSQDQDKRNSQHSCGSQITTTDIKDSIQGGFSASDALGVCKLDSIHNEDWWRSMSFAEKLSFLGASTSDVISKAYDSAAPSWQDDDMTGVFHVWTLSELATKSGTSSSGYKAALKDVELSLSALLSSSASDVTVVLVPYDKHSKLPRAARRATGTKRSSIAKRQTSDVPSSLPKTTIPSCYPAEDACQTATANCSGHGSCVLRWTDMVVDDEQGFECWGCACQDTVLAEGDDAGYGRRTISWGGPACQKKDISVPFWLFAGFGVFMAAAISFGIGMLYSVGEIELPSVLGAGVASVGARNK